MNRAVKKAYSEILAAVETAKREWRELHGIRYVQIETSRGRQRSVWAAIARLETDGVIDSRKTVEDWRIVGAGDDGQGETEPRIFVCWNGHDETGRGPDIDFNRSADVYI